MRRKSWDKGQSTLEYFIIFAVIACVAIPLWKGSAFSGIQDSGKGFFTACVDRILKDSEAGEPSGPASVQLKGMYYDLYEKYGSEPLCYFQFVVMDNECKKIKLTFITSGGVVKDENRLEWNNVAPGNYGVAEPDPAFSWKPSEIGIFSWVLEVEGGTVEGGLGSSGTKTIAY